MSAHHIRLIHVACRDLGLDEDTRRDLQLAVTGKDSLKSMSEPELVAVVEALKSKGFKPSGGKQGRKGHRQSAPRGDLRYVHVLWGRLVAANAVQVPGVGGLNAFIRARFEKAFGAVPIDVDQMRDWKQIATVIEALKAMCARAGVKL